MQSALQTDENGDYQKIPYRDVLLSFKLSDLALQTHGEGDVSARRSLMTYMGGLTFDSEEPSKFLKIPNFVAAKRFGTALLNRVKSFGFRDALYVLAKDGNPMDVLSGYCYWMRAHDNGVTAFEKTEEIHRNIILASIMENHSVRPKGEYEVRKVTDHPGFVDLLITNKKDLYTLLEFKRAGIRYLGLDGGNSDDKAKGRTGMTWNEVLKHKAKQLEPITLDQILDLKFEHDYFGRNGMTIRNWIDGKTDENNHHSGDVRNQLRSYIAGSTVQNGSEGKNFRGFAVVIVGSRHILVREMNRDGEWVTEFQLAEPPSME